MTISAPTSAISSKPGEMSMPDRRISQGKNEQACEDFEQVLALEPQNYDRMIQIFEVLNTAGLTQIGQGYLDSALSYAEGKNAAFRFAG